MFPQVASMASHYAVAPQQQSFVQALQQLLHSSNAPQPQSQRTGPKVDDINLGAEIETPITTASLPLYKLPKVRLSECVEHISKGDIDATLTSNLSQQGLAILLWMFSKVRPDLKVTELRVKTYQQLARRLAVAHERSARSNPLHFQSFINTFLTQAAPLEDKEVISRAKSMGFNEDWVKPPNKKKSDCGAIKGPPDAEDKTRAPIGEHGPPDAEAKTRAPIGHPAHMTKPAAQLDPEPLESLGSRGLDQDEPAPKRRRTNSTVEPTPTPFGPRWFNPHPTVLVPRDTPPILALTDAVREPSPRDDSHLLGPGLLTGWGPQPQEVNKLSCVFCQGDLMDGAPLEALLCGHTYHSECLEQYCLCSGKTKEEGCPFKCHETSLSSSSTGVAETFEIEDQGDDSDAQILAAAVTEQNLASSVIG